jgi:hypothetical protein
MKKKQRIGQLPHLRQDGSLYQTLASQCMNPQDQHCNRTGNQRKQQEDQENGQKTGTRRIS